MVMKYLDTLPKLLLTLMGALMVVAVGVIDWMTGDYSILVFYTIPIFVVSWSAGRWYGISICIAAGCARFISDIPLHDFSIMNYWNAFIDTCLFLTMSLLVSQLRKKLE